MGNRAAELLVKLARLAIADEKSLAQFRRRARADEPTERSAGNRAKDQSDKSENLRIHGPKLHGTERERQCFSGDYPQRKVTPRGASSPAF